MQITAVSALLFSASALAQFGGFGGPGFGGPGFGGGFQQGYRARCTCVSNGQVDTQLGQAACQSLGSIWPNLQFDWNSGACADAANVGLEPQGWEAACQRVGGGFGGGFGGLNNNPWQPNAVRGVCSDF